MKRSRKRSLFIRILICMTAIPTGLPAEDAPLNANMKVYETMWQDGSTGREDLIPDEKPGKGKSMIDAGASSAAAGLVKRILPEHADRFLFEVIQPENGRDVFEIVTYEGKVIIRGNTGTSMATGLNWYLEQYCKCNVSWCGNQLDLPDKLPELKSAIRKTSWTKYRYFLNYCCFGYSLAWWDWQQWEQLIDWMALNGINAPLAVTGQEATWQAVCKRLRLSDEQISHFLAGPPYLPFGWMGCLDGWGGPLPQSWINSHEQLAKKILARERELGMKPVQQGFTGHVPEALRDKYPDAKLYTINWIDWTTYLLDPLDPLFEKVAGIFMEEQYKRFGTDHLYAADTYIEMTPPSGDTGYLANMSNAIYNGMGKSDPEAVWVLQTWMFLNKRDFWTQPRIEAFLGAIPDDKMLCLDLYCEERPQWSRTRAFYGKPWLWCNVQNFGRNVHLGGALEKNNSGLMGVREDPEKGRLVGLGFVNEGLGYNPVAYDLMFGMAWRSEAIDLSEWIGDYAVYRYGKQNTDAKRAWLALKNTVYMGPARTRSIIMHHPTLNPAGALPYSNKQLADAYRYLLNASGELGRSDTYRFDLVNIARQVLSNHAAVLHQNIIAAYDEKNYGSFRNASDDFLELMVDLDELLATRPEFLLGEYLEDAKRWGTTPQEKAILEWNARRVLTLWGKSTILEDYACKEWSGMIKGFYHTRWKWYLDKLARSLEADEPFDDAEFQGEINNWMDRWSESRETYPSQPKGDCVAVAKKLWDKYHVDFK